MKNLVSLFAVLSSVFVSLNSFAQIQTFGVLRTGTASAIQLATINPVSGSVTTLSATPFTNVYVGNAIATIDPFNKVYYIQSQGKLFGIDMTNGSTVSSPTISTPVQGYFDMMVFNCSDTTVYGLFRNGSTQALQLAKINPATGVVSAISPTPFTATYVWNGWATIDRINKIYYIQSGGSLWGVSLTSGTLVTSPAVNCPFPGYFDMMIYNNNNATLYGLLRNSSSQSIELAKINVSTGAVTSISSTTFTNTFVLNAGSAIDPVNGVYYIQSSGKFWGLDLATGTVVSSPTLGIPANSYFDMMEMNINNCEGSYDVGIVTGVKEELGTAVGIFPNPAKNSCFIRKPGSSSGELLLINALGQKVLEQKVTAQTTEISTTSLPRGIYYCILLERGQNTSYKLILE